MPSKKIDITETISFTEKDIGILFFAMRFTSAEFDKQIMNYPTRKPDQTDKLTAMETFRELKKWLDDKNQYKKCSLVLWTTQKALLIKYINEISRETADLENELNVLEKLQ